MKSITQTHESITKYLRYLNKIKTQRPEILNEVKIYWSKKLKETEVVTVISSQYKNNYHE
jgi:hypothetical protein